MRAWLLVCAALALAPCRATAARPHPDPARLERIKSQILAKLGLSTRPTPLGAPPRDVVRQILARAADPHPRPTHIEDNEHAMREVIAIAHRGYEENLAFVRLEGIDAVENSAPMTRMQVQQKCKDSELSNGSSQVMVEFKHLN